MTLLKFCSSFLWTDWGDLAQILLEYGYKTGVISILICA